MQSRALSTVRIQPATSRPRSACPFQAALTNKHRVPAVVLVECTRKHDQRNPDSCEERQKADGTQSARHVAGVGSSSTGGPLAHAGAAREKTAMGVHPSTRERYIGNTTMTLWCLGKGTMSLTSRQGHGFASTFASQAERVSSPSQRKTVE